MGEKDPYYRKRMSISFPDVPHTKGFVALSLTVRNLWGKAYISYMLKYTIGMELDRKRAPMGFVAFSHKVQNLWGNPCICHMLKYT